MRRPSYGSGSRPIFVSAPAKMGASVLKTGRKIGTLSARFAGRLARMLDEAAAMPGVKGLMLTFDDFLIGMDAYGERIQPLMQCRKHVASLAA